MSNNNKDNKMSKYFYTLVFFLGFILGCGKYSDTVGPVDVQEGNEPNWIVIPSAENKSLEKEIFTGKWVCGDSKSVLRLKEFYLASTPFRFVRISARAEFQKNSFEGCTFITMSVNDRFGITTFSPDCDFSKPVIYNLTISGIDLSGINPETVKFVYMAPDGQYYPAECDQLRADPKLGLLQVVNARLPHFSRYGFAN